MENILENKVVLVDTHKNKSGLKLLTESSEIEAYKGNPNALGVLYGPCSDFTTQTSNDHYYSEKLWDRVLNSDYVKEAIETKTLFGEIDHPEERLELKAEYAAINCTKLWKDTENKCLMGSFDILPTEKGKILKALCDYGSVLGVSSRGIGDLTPDPQLGSVVNEDTYLFVCFDVVVQPAAKKARQMYKSLTEQNSLRKSVVESLIESIHNSTTEAELNNTCELIERLQLKSKNLDDIITEKRNLLKTNESNPIIKVNRTLKKDLEQAYEKIRILEGQNDVTNLMAEMSFIRSQLLLLKENTSQNSEIVKELKKVGKSLKEKKADETSQVAVLEEQVKGLKDQINCLQTQLKEAQEQNTKQQIANNKLQETVDYAVSFVHKCKEKFSKLIESNKSLTNKNASLASKLMEVQEDYNTTKSQLASATKLAEENKRLVQNFREEYIGQKEAAYGSDLSMARRKVNEAKSLKDIDLIISETSNKTANIRRPNVLTAMMESGNPETSFDSGNDDHGEISVIREALRNNRRTH